MHAGYASHVLGPLLTLAVGLGMVFVSTSVVAISGISPNESGLASALLNVGRQLGGSLGIALMGTVAATVTTHQLANGPVTRPEVSSALTAGYATAFQMASAVALAGFLVALATIRGRRISTTPGAQDVAA